MGAAFTSLDEHDFDALRADVYDACGIALDRSKYSLVIGRLQPVLQREGIASYREYIDRVRADATGRLRSELVDRLTTNHTFFWRESDHFDHFAQVVLPALVRNGSGGRKLRVWCAASSFGQEPYTLAALMLDALGAGASAWDYGLLATDISTGALERAREGVYDGADVARLPEDLRRRHFEAVANGRFAANARLRETVTFRRFNLMNERFPFKHPFDVVFIRNVMIYFDMPTKLGLCARLAGAMRTGAHLYIGTAESLPPDQAHFVSVRPGVFRKR
jgi:chemotaxis protein methyltransferase CheR